MARKAFEKRGMTIKTETQASVKVGSKSVTATLTHKDKSETAEFDRVILAIGIVGNTEDMGLEELGV